MWEIDVHLAVAGGVYDGVFLCCSFSHEMSWMRSWTLLSQFLPLAKANLNFQCVGISKPVTDSSTFELNFSKGLDFCADFVYT